MPNPLNFFTEPSGNATPELDRQGRGSATILVTNVGTMLTRCGDYTLIPGVPVEVPLSFLGSFGATPNLSFDFSPMADHLRTHTEDGRPSFDFWCPLSGVDGYGRHALAIWRGLGMIGADATLRSCGLEHLETISAEIMHEKVRNQYRQPAKVSVAMTVPYDPKIYDTPSVTRIALTQFETDTIPFRHIERVNQAQHLIVTSSFQPRIWRKAGLKIPIDVMTPGIDVDAFPFVERPSDGPFKVLILGALSSRKNVPGAIRIFQAASKGDPAWQLTVKSRGGKMLPEEYELISADPRITLFEGDLNDAGVRQLYESHHCLLWPSKGEGVGLPPMEAMASGMEVVIADNSGMQDFVSSSWCWPIKTDHMESAAGEGCYGAAYIARHGDVGQWWVPDEKHGAKQLTAAFDAWMDGKGKGPLAAKYIREHHTLKHQAASVLRVVERYL